MANEKELLAQARQYIKERQFDRARILLEDIADNPTAAEWLEKLDRVDPAPQNFDEARREIDQMRGELEDAEDDIRTAQQAGRRAFTVSTALLVFLGSLFGSLIGTVADFGDAVETVNEFRAAFYPQLCIVGSDTILGPELGMAAAWAETFEEDHDVRVRIDAIGSSNGVQRAVEGGCAHVLAMSEPMNEDQYDRLQDNGVELACAAEIGYDIVVFIIDINNPISSVPDNSLTSILQGRQQTWGFLSTQYDFPVTILVREGSGTTDLVLDRIARYPSEGGRVFPAEGNYQVCDSNEDCLNRTLSTPGALYWVSAAWMSTQPPQYLRVLRMIERDEASVNPLTEEVNLARYPRSLQRPLYLYVLDGEDTSDEQLEFGREFLEYVRGVEGQSTLSENFFYTYFNQPSTLTASDVPFPPGFDAINTPNRRICCQGRAWRCKRRRRHPPHTATPPRIHPFPADRPPVAVARHGSASGAGTHGRAPISAPLTRSPHPDWRGRRWPHPTHGNSQPHQCGRGLAEYGSEFRPYQCLC
jgi:ABC-type phosphate transport system substrate-binding protein